MGQRQALGMLRRRLEQVRLGPDVALERHDDFLADRVDRRVGHLREELLEVVVEHRGCSREHAERVSLPIEPTGSRCSSTIGAA